MVKPSDTRSILLSMRSTDEQLEMRRARKINYIFWVNTFKTITGLTIRIGIDPRLIRKCAAVAPRSDASYFPVVSIQCNQWSTRITLHFQNT